MEMEKDIKNWFKKVHQSTRDEMYSYTDLLFEDYVSFIKSHKFFVKEVFIKKKEEPAQITKIVKKTTPSLGDRWLTGKELL